jgi:hypothetical protein
MIQITSVFIEMFPVNRNELRRRCGNEGLKDNAPSRGKNRAGPAGVVEAPPSDVGEELSERQRQHPMVSHPRIFDSSAAHCEL